MPVDTTLFFCGRPPGVAWSFAELSATFAMWLGMMVGMMGPLVLPWIVAFARADGNSFVINRRMRIGLFLLGYMLVWAVSGLVATLLQQVLAEEGQQAAGSPPASEATGTITIDVAAKTADRAHLSTRSAIRRDRRRSDAIPGVPG